MPEPNGTPTREEHLAAEAEAERRGLVGSSTAYSCDFCETNWSDALLRSVDFYSDDGMLNCKLICRDCVAAFASDDIEFD